MTQESPDALLAAAIRQLVQAEVASQVAAALAARPSDLMTTAEAARHAKVSPATVRRWITAGKLTEHRAGREVRIARADLEKLLHRGTRRTAAVRRTPEQIAADRFG